MGPAEGNRGARRNSRRDRITGSPGESGSKAFIVDYVGRSEYSFSVPEDVVAKEVHWYLMSTDSYYSKPQREEYFADSGFYKYHEAYHLLKFANEKQILEKAYAEYLERKRNNQWK